MNWTCTASPSNGPLTQIQADSALLLCCTTVNGTHVNGTSPAKCVVPSTGNTNSSYYTDMDKLYSCFMGLGQSAPAAWTCDRPDGAHCTGGLDVRACTGPTASASTTAPTASPTSGAASRAGKSVIAGLVVVLACLVVA